MLAILHAKIVCTAKMYCKNVLYDRLSKNHLNKSESLKVCHIRVHSNVYVL